MENVQQITRETLAKVQAALKGVNADPSLKKSITTATGVTGLNMEAGLHQIVPLLTALRQSIPRKTVPGSSAIQWKQLTALGFPDPATTKGAAGPLFTTTTASKSAAYKVVALRGQVDREAQAESETFEDARALEQANCLLGHQKLEEIQILGGNITALAAAANPAAVGTSTGGSIGAATYFAKVAPITIPAYNRTAQDTPLDYDGTDAKLAGVSHTSADIDVTASGNGIGPLSAEATTGALSGSTNKIKITWDPVPGAGAYLVFVGTVTGNANLKLEAIVTQSSVTLTSLGAGGLLASTLVDTSASTLHYDGILASTIAGGGYIKYVNGKLTGSNGEVLEIQDAFAYLWRTKKVGAFRILVAGDDQRTLTRLGISQNSLNIVVGADGSGRSMITMGGRVGKIMNSVSGFECPVEVMPWLPSGMIMILPLEMPYNSANVREPFDMVFAYDVEQWEYSSTPTTGPVWGFEMRCEGVLRPKFPAGCGILANIFKG